MRIDRSALVCALVATLPLMAACSSDAPSNGGTEEDLVARWWNWAAAAEPANPVSDLDGSDCDVDQPDDVWFLAGSFGERVTRTCAVPSGVPVFGPVANLVCEVGAQPVETVASTCVGEWDVATVVLDGEPLPTVELESDGEFDLVLDEGNPLFEGGDSVIQAYGSGIWFGPVDIADGTHTLRIVASAEGFELDVTYELTVGE